MKIADLTIAVGITHGDNAVVLYAGIDPAKAKARADRAKATREVTEVLVFPLSTIVRQPTPAPPPTTATT